MAFLTAIFRSRPAHLAQLDIPELPDPEITPSYKDKLFAAIPLSGSTLDKDGYPKMCICDLFGMRKEFVGNCCRDFFNPRTCHRCWDMPYEED